MTIHQYPKMLYGEKGATMIVPTPEAHTAAGAGWTETPSDEHRAITAVIPPQQSGQEALIEAVAQRTAELVMAAMKAEPPPPFEEPVRRGRAKPADTLGEA